MTFLDHIRGYLQQPLVRPWALAGPVLIIILCLPLLEPLRQPDPNQWNDEQQMLASTVQALVERHTLAIEGTVFADNPLAIPYQGHLYSPYPPMLAALVAPVYWIMMKQGLYYADDLILVQYLLTLIYATVPLAMCVGLVYRLGRMFELRRSLRLSLALAAVLGGGLVSYGVVLNRHVPAAALLLITVSCISHLAVARYPHRHLAYAAAGGLCAALAAMLDPTAMVFALLPCLVLLAMRWNAAMRVGAISLYVLGAVPVLLLNSAMMHPASGSAAYLAPTPPDAMASLALPVSRTAESLLDADEFDDSSFVADAWHHVAVWIGRVLEGLVGEHGVLSHYPVLIVGFLGVVWTLHRNWTGTTKSLASICLLACLIAILLFAIRPSPGAMSYGAPWFICLSPLLILWAGVWLKRTHRAQSWSMVGVAMGYSLIVGLVGMNDPIPRQGYTGYSFTQASFRLLRPAPKPPRPVPATLPGEALPDTAND